MLGAVNATESLRRVQVHRWSDPATVLGGVHEDDLDHLMRLSPDLAVRELVPVLTHIAHAVGPRMLTRIPLHMGDPSAAPFVALDRRGRTAAYALQLFVWPPHATTAIHDHSCWGAFYTVGGALHETRYVRLDDETKLNQAHIRTTWHRAWERDAGVSTLLPYAGGIHRVNNPSDTYAFSVHLYGPPEAVDGRDYDPRRDYVCDRPPEAVPSVAAE